MVLSDGSEHIFDRGSEQGEPLGSLKAALPLGDARGRVLIKGDRPSRVCDEWYIDDGQLICSPALFDPWLQAFGLGLAAVRATRGSGAEVKSTARLVRPAERCQEFEGWDTEYVRRTCKVNEANSPAKALGAIFGSDDVVQKGAFAVLDKVRDVRSAISTMGHAPSELVLTRRCADVGKVSYWLRCYGDTLRGVVCSRFDTDLRDAMEEILNGPLSDAAWWQSNLGVRDGGLGIRRASDVALMAFIGSRVASRPLVACMLEHVQSADLGCANTLLHAYDSRTNSAVDALLRSFPAEAAQRVHDFIADGVVHAARTWQAYMSPANGQGAYATGDDDDDPHMRQSGSVSPGLVMDAGAEDEEHPDYGGGPRSTKVQRALSKLLDECIREGLCEHHRRSGSPLDCERLSDLAHHDTSHSWLWALCAAQGPAIDDDAEFIEAVRVRLGTGGPGDVAVCGLCGQAQLDTAGGHASCCSLGEATVGHDAIRDCVYRYGCEADHATEWEPQDLVSSQPRARPADVLTPAAFPGRVAALDVGVVSPAAHPGVDAAEAMAVRKNGEREPIRGELERQNIVYKPIVWTTYGRPHWQASIAMRGIAKRISRRRGCKVGTVLAQIQSAIGVCLARRAARMSLACRPRALAAMTGANIATAVGVHFVHAPGDGPASAPSWQ